MKQNNDVKQYLYVLFTLIIEIYKIGMGTFLVLFVPQKCDDHACQIVELVHSQYIYNQIGLCVNAFTLCMILFTYMWELKREKWCIKNLDSSKDVTYNSLRYTLNDQPQIDNTLRSLNLHYIRSLRLTSCVCFVNFVCSGYIIYPRYLDISTMTSYLSFALLLIMKLKTSYGVGKQSYDSALALSAYMTDPLSFNILDADEYQVTNGAGLPLSYQYQAVP